MTAPVVTGIREDLDNMTLGVTPIKVELKGKPAPFVKVEKIQDLTRGGYSVKITAPLEVAVSTLDAIARNVLPGAKVTLAGKGPARIRHYAP
jgi:hypothetical protein